MHQFWWDLCIEEVLCLLLQVTRSTITSVLSTSTLDQETVNGLQYQSPTGEWWATSVKSKMKWSLYWKITSDSFHLFLTSSSLNSFPLLLSFPHHQEQHQLPDGLVVAQPGGPVWGRCTRVSVHPASRRPGVAQHRHCPLGPGYRLVQQHRLERWTSHRYAWDFTICSS